MARPTAYEPLLIFARHTTPVKSSESRRANPGMTAPSMHVSMVGGSNVSLRLAWAAGLTDLFEAQTLKSAFPFGYRRREWEEEVTDLFHADGSRRIRSYRPSAHRGK